MGGSKTQDGDGDVSGAATLPPLWSPCVKHEEEVAEGEEEEAWNRRPQSAELEVPRWLWLQPHLFSYIQRRKLRIR